MAKQRVAVLGSVGKSILIDDSFGPRLTAVETAINALRKAGSGSTLRHSSLQGLQIGNDHPQYPLSRGRETIRGQWDFAKPIWASLGTAALPGYAFFEAQNMGLYGTKIAGDPYFANVVVLAHMDGANGGTAFVDSSSYARSLTTVSGGTTSTTQIKWGTAAQRSAASSGGGCSFPDAAEINLTTERKWTIEFWYYRISGGAGFPFQKNNFSSVFPVSIDFQPGNTLRASGSDGTGVTAYSITSPGAFPQDAWTHVALVRNTNTITLYVGGVSVGSATYTGDLGNQVAGGKVFQIGNSFFSDGWLDDFRMTIGVARYTGASLTVPTAAFPNTGDVTYESMTVGGVEQVRVETDKATFYQTAVGVDAANAFVAGVGTPGWPAAFLSRRKVTIHADYGFIDESEFALAGGVGGHASFATRNAITCAAGAGHANDFQARSLFTNPVAVTDVTGVWVQPEFNGGVATNTYGARFLDPLYSGAGGTITNNYGLWLGDMTRGATLNYSIWADGTSPSRFGGELRLNRQGTGAPGTSAFKLDSAVPVAEWQVSTAAADGRRWLVFGAGNSWSMNAFNDAGTVSRAIFAITRTAGTPDITDIEFGNATNNATVTLRGTGALNSAMAGTWTGQHKFNATSGTRILSGAAAFNPNPIVGDPAHLIDIVNDATAFQAIRLSTYGLAASVFQNNFHWQRAGGTVAAPTAVLNGDTFMSMGYRGHDGTAISQSAASFTAVATENWASGAHGIKFEFQVTPNLSTTRATHLGISADNVYVPGLGFVVGAAAPLNTAANRGNITVNGPAAAIVNLGVAGVTEGIMYSDGTQMLLGTSTNTPLIFRTNATTAVTIGANGQAKFTGNSTSAIFGDGSGDESIAFDGGAGQLRVMSFRSAGANRWSWVTENTAESGGNAGSNFELWRYTDAGSFLGTALSVNRATGVATWEAQNILPAGTTTRASLRVPHGAAPSSPTNGDMWTTTAGLFVRINGVTVGPLT